MPNDYATFDVAWQGQVPVTLERSGRDNSSGVAYSFTQWYPKICVYDRFGWHATPHIGREFFGDYGSFKVNITLPKKYVVAASGVLKNANAIGFGYQEEGATPPPNYGLVNVWKFEADNVHDFAWAADPDFVHEKIKVRNDLTLHFLYQPSPEVTPAFRYMQKFAVAQLPYIEANFGKYLYPQFTFAQGGQWAMEYPMLTLIEKNDHDTSMTATAVHEWMHNWFYGMLGNNEIDNHWLDEGFASYATSDILCQTTPDSAESYRRAALDQVVLNSSGVVDPAGTPANFFKKDEWYFYNAYTQGESFLWQLRYITGDEAFRRGMLRYYADWHFKHPTGDDFLRTMERASGMELDWYHAGWIKTRRKIDYAVDKIAFDGATSTTIVLKNEGELAMPVELLVEFNDGSTERHYIPLDVQYGSKTFPGNTVVTHDPWSFSSARYEIRLDKPVTSVKSVTVDPENRLADSERKNNRKVN